MTPFEIPADELVERIDPGDLSLLHYFRQSGALPVAPGAVGFVDRMARFGVRIVPGERLDGWGLAVAQSGVALLDRRAREQDLLHPVLPHSTDADEPA